MKTKLAVLAAAVAMLASPALAGETLDRVMKSGKLTMASEADYPPQSFLNDNNEMDGFDVSVGKEIAKRLGVEFASVTPAWEMMVSGGWSGRWDVAVGSMTPTKARAEVLNFPAIYYYTPAAFAVHTDSKVQSLDELNGKVIGSCGGCTYDAYLMQDLVIDAEGTPPFEYQVKAGELKTWHTSVARGSRGRGIAVALKHLAIRAAIRRGAPALWTSNDSRNAAMLRVNAKLGFEDTPGVYYLRCEL